MTTPPVRSAALLAALLLAGCGSVPMGINFDEKALPSATTDTAAPPAEVKLKPINAQVVSELRAARTKARAEAYAQARETLDLRGYQYRVGPQDVLSFIVWDHPELTIPAGSERSPDSSGHRVRPDGTIFFPYVGTVQVGGKTLEEIRAILTTKLARYIQDPQLDVSVAAYRSQKVHVTGEVAKPGILPITDSPLTLLDAVAASGGENPEADLSRVILTRNGEREVIDLQAALSEGLVGYNRLLRDADLVHVPDRSTRKVFVMGEVEKQSVQLIQKTGMSLAEALGQAGGVDKKVGDGSRIFVLRAGHGSDTPVEAFNLNASTPEAMLLATRFELEPLDIVYVDITGLGQWNNIISQLWPTIQSVRYIADTVNTVE